MVYTEVWHGWTALYTRYNCCTEGPTVVLHSYTEVWHGWTALYTRYNCCTEGPTVVLVH